MNDVETIDDRVEKIRPLLAGLEPGVQMAILADLLSMWLAGHHLLDENLVETAKVREEMLQLLVHMTRDLTPINHLMMVERLKERS